MKPFCGISFAKPALRHAGGNEFALGSRLRRYFMAAFKALAERKNGDGLVEIRLHLQEIARSEIMRHRNRLASLTTEQQSAVEALLTSMVDSVSRQIIDGVQHYPEEVRKKTVSVWCGALVA